MKFATLLAINSLSLTFAGISQHLGSFPISACFTKDSGLQPTLDSGL